MTVHNKEIKPRAELHDRIIDTAMKEFTTKGIKPVRMDDIANRLSISKRTLYEIFQDKEELLFECVKRNQQETLQYMTAVHARSSNIMEVILELYFKNLEDLQRIHYRFFEDMKKYPKVTDYIRKSRESNLKTSVEFLQKGIEQGLFRKDIDMEIALRLMNSSSDFMTKENLAQTYPLDKILRTLIFIFIRGISTEKGKGIFDHIIAEYENRIQKTTLHSDF